MRICGILPISSPCRFFDVNIFYLLDALEIGIFPRYEGLVGAGFHHERFPNTIRFRKRTSSSTPNSIQKLIRQRTAIRIGNNDQNRWGRDIFIIISLPFPPEMRSLLPIEEAGLHLNSTSNKSRPNRKKNGRNYLIAEETPS